MNQTIDKTTSPVPVNWVFKLTPMFFVVLWSTGFVVARLGMAYAPPLGLLSWRFGLSAVLLTCIALAMRAKFPGSAHEIFHLAVCGLLMQACYLGGVWVSVRHGMSAGISALVVGMQPVLTALLVSYLGHKVRPRQWLGLLVGFIGLTLVVLEKTKSGEFNLINTSTIVMALLGITAGTLYQKYLVKPSNVWWGMSIQLWASVPPIVLLSMLESDAMVWNQQVIVSLVWGILGLTLGASSLLYILIRRGSAVNVSSMMYCVPPCAALFGWIGFGEKLGLTALLGMALVAVAVAMVTRAKT